MSPTASQTSGLLSEFVVFVFVSWDSEAANGALLRPAAASLGSMLWTSRWHVSPWEVLGGSTPFCLNRQLEKKKWWTSKKKKRKRWRCEVEHSTTVSLSLSARPPGSFTPWGGGGLTQGGQDIPGVSTPEAEGIMSGNPLGRRADTACKHRTCLAL